MINCAFHCKRWHQPAGVQDDGTVNVHSCSVKCGSGMLYCELRAICMLEAGTTEILDDIVLSVYFPEKSIIYYTISMTF